ncbi:hypothetical protein C8R43DRAFT_609370 [Mycena crocata]|nr:hypothetical protein C8R43DRAFT_609370 [Mycena crocata]
MDTPQRLRRSQHLRSTQGCNKLETVQIRFRGSGPTRVHKTLDGSCDGDFGWGSRVEILVTPPIPPPIILASQTFISGVNIELAHPQRLNIDYPRGFPKAWIHNLFLYSNKIAAFIQRSAVHGVGSADLGCKVNSCVGRFSARFSCIGPPEIPGPPEIYKYPSGPPTHLSFQPPPTFRPFSHYRWLLPRHARRWRCLCLSLAPLVSCFVTAVALTPLDAPPPLTLSSMPTRPQDFRYRLMTHQVLVIAASPPPPPTTTSTPAQRFNRLRNVSFSSIPPFSSSGWRHNVFKPSYGLIFLPLGFLPVPSHFGAPIQIQTALTPYLDSSPPRTQECVFKP